MNTEYWHKSTRNLIDRRQWQQVRKLRLPLFALARARVFFPVLKTCTIIEKLMPFGVTLPGMEYVCEGMRHGLGPRLLLRSSMASKATRPKGYR